MTDPLRRHDDPTGPADRHGATGRADRIDGPGDPYSDGATEGRVRPAKTSGAAVFALVFGLLAFVFALLVILSPVALILGIIGIVLGIVGLKASGRVGITGKGVAISGLVLSILGVLIVGVIAAGVVTALNNESTVNWIEERVNDLRDEIPEDVEIDTP